MIWQLSCQQRLAFNTILTWCRNVVKCASRNDITAPKLFITGWAGARKSYQIKTIYQMARKTFQQISENPEKPLVLLLAPPEIAAINISGTTINTGLSIPVDMFSNSVTPLSDVQRSTLRNCFSELKMIIVDEISMISNMKFLCIHQRLTDIFGTPEYKLFGGKALIAVGDLYQLPPSKGKPIFVDHKEELLNLCHPWKDITLIVLTEIMRQKNDTEFAELLNRLRTGASVDTDIETMNSSIISTNDPCYPWEALHVFAENSAVKEHNSMMLDKLSVPPITLAAIDKYPENVSSSSLEKTLSQSFCQTDGLHREIDIKECACIMLATNLSIEDRLINGQVRTVKKFILTCLFQTQFT